MNVKKIKIKDFRNIKKAEVAFADGVNLLVGDNAQGKTNLLEAVFYVAIGKSFRAARDEDMIRFGAEICEVSMDFTDSVREQNLTVRMMPGKRRRIEHNRVRLGRVSDVVGLFRTVLFCPEHLALVKEGPAERRNFLDVAISQLYPNYLRALQNYNQILKQRNQLIRAAEDDRATFDATVELWSAQLAKEAAVIAQYRRRYIQLLGPAMKECFSEMTGGKEKPDVNYLPSLKREPEEFEDAEKIESLYFEQLMSHHEREIAAGSTLWGIHKDDIQIDLDGKSARDFASQGQQRSLALAMKLSEGDICRQICGEVPVFLLDDVFSELDGTRRSYLAGRIRGRQVIITACDPALPSINAGKVFRVVNGTYTEEITEKG